VSKKRAADESASPPSEAEQFEREAQSRTPNVFVEFLEFLIHNKKWWLTPIFVILLVLGILAALLSSPAAPFIYPFF
jgi:hypothetical protein